MGSRLGGRNLGGENGFGGGREGGKDWRGCFGYYLEGRNGNLRFSLSKRLFTFFPSHL